MKLMNYDQKALGLRISYYREFNNYSQADLGSKTGISQSYIANIESGKGSSISLEKLVKLSNVLNVSVDELLCDSLIKKLYNKDTTDNKQINMILNRLDILNEEQVKHFYRFLIEFQKYKSYLKLSNK